MFVKLGLVLVFAGVGFKIAAVPFHLWVPDTYEAASPPFVLPLSLIVFLLSIGGMFRERAVLDTTHLSCNVMRRGWAVGLCVFLSACGGSKGPTSPSGSSLPAGPLSFTFSPIDLALIQFIVPLGNMGPYAHTLPTDHIYFYHHLYSGRFTPVPIRVPASGSVEFILPVNADGENKTGIRVNGTFLYYFDHITLAPGISVGSHVEAGSLIGTSTNIAFDFNVTNSTISLGFVNPVRYGGSGGLTLSTDAPLKYFAEPIRSQLYAKVQRVGADLDGQINYDVAGTLAGNWFAEDLPPTQSQGGDASTGGKQIAFARDVRFPDRLRVSIGGLGMTTGLYGVPPEAVDFPAVTTASGVVVYRLLNTGEPGGAAGTSQVGLLVVQMLDGQRIRVEAVANPVASTAEFSANAKIYVR